MTYTMTINRYKEIFKYVFEQIGLKYHKHMIKELAMFLLPKTVDNLMGRNIEIAKDIYTGKNMLTKTIIKINLLIG